MEPAPGSGHRDSDWTMAVTTDHLDDAVQQTKRRATERHRELTERTAKLIHQAEEMHRELLRDLDLLQRAIDYVDPGSAPRQAPTRSAQEPVPAMALADSPAAPASKQAYLVRTIIYGDEDARGRAPVGFDAWPAVELSAQERTLLRILAEDVADGRDVHDGIVPYKTRQQVLARMKAQWDKDFNSSALNAAIWRLRRKLGKVRAGGRAFVQSRPDGYRLRVLR